MLSTNLRVYLAAGKTDLRKSFDGLAAATKEAIGLDPLSRHLFCFTNRARNRLKILYWNHGGYWVFAKRLELGTFSWPAIDGSGARKVEMSLEKFALLLGGIDVKAFKDRRWFEAAPPRESSR